jgi:SAM-dependent methyltransferase
MPIGEAPGVGRGALPVTFRPRLVTHVTEGLGGPSWPADGSMARAVCATTLCPVCLGAPYAPFLRMPSVPVHVGALWPTREKAVGCPKGELDLCVCHGCGFVGNRAFDPARVDYDAQYDNALHHSPFFQKFERELAERLVEQYGVRGRDVIEIGSGTGHFLALLGELGGNRGVGFDPSHEAAYADPGVGDGVRVVRDYYGEAYADLPLDFLVCRQVLEHVPEPRPFLEALRPLLARHPGAIGYFEVPNALLALRDLSIWNLIYEHPGNHTPTSLAELFRACGFEVLDVRESYEGQFVSAEVRASDAPRGPAPEAGAVAETVGLAESLGEHFRAIRARWDARLAALAAEGRRAAVWGGGAKGVSFLNLLAGGQEVDCVVDINPRKQGSFLPGTGQRIVAPEALRERPPDLVIVMNPIYEAEIREQLAALGVATPVESV